MRRSYLVATAFAVALCGSTTVAGAASDYYLKLGDIKGESTDASAGQELDVASFSWGTSNASLASSTAASGGTSTAIRESPTRAGIKTAREAASGMATGRRSPSAVATDNVASSSTAVAEPGPGADNTLSVIVPATGGEAAATLDRACATGEHIKEAVLRSGDKTYEMTDLVVVSCTTRGAQRMVTFKTGHVTLMK